ncbi:MAG: hypothetical protein ACOC6U_02150 [Thermoplasmatota archaeon]
MMKKVIIVALIIFISFIMAGCSNPPSPPGSEIPMVVVDYIPSNRYDNIDENNSIIYVHGLDEVRYQNITIKVNNKTLKTRNHTYSLEVITNLTSFELEVDVYHYDKRFDYRATFNISEKKNIMYQITYPNLETKEVNFEDLPYSEKLEQIEEK